MDRGRVERVSATMWRVAPTGEMRVPAIIFADEALLTEMDDKVLEQATNVATLPGIVGASYVMPDGHWGYGFPIGGVAAFDPARGGIVSAGGVGFDISCGVRCLTTGRTVAEVRAVAERLADLLFRAIPAGVGSTGSVRLDDDELDAMLAGGAAWAVERGWGAPEDLERIEERGRMAGARPEHVSELARRRQRDEMGTLGSGNHYLEVQQVAEIHEPAIAEAFGLAEGEVVISIHCGSRGLGHQIGTEFLREMAVAAPRHHLVLPDRELACAPLRSELGERYLGAMRSGINCAFANRQILTALTREVVGRLFADAELRILYDVSHNTCKEEEHEVDGVRRRLFVHRKGATRAWGPGHAQLPPELRDAGQPVLVGGSMGTRSYVLAGTTRGMTLAFGSACHGAGRAMSRHAALRRWRGREVIAGLEARGILVRSRSWRGVAEEAPGAYKDVSAVVETAHAAGLAVKVATLLPMICVKG